MAPRGKKTKNVKMDTKKIKAIVREELKEDVEVKYLLTNHQSLSIDTTGELYSLTNVSQGTGDSNRIGDEIKISALELRINALYGDTTNYLRIIVFQWLANDDISAPIVGDVLYDASSSIPYVLSYYNNDTLGSDYSVLYDKVHSLNNTYKTNFSQNIFIPMKYAKKKVQYVAGTTNGSHKLYILLCSDSGAIPHVTVNMVARLTYVDC